MRFNWGYNTYFFCKIFNDGFSGGENGGGGILGLLRRKLPRGGWAEAAGQQEKVRMIMSKMMMRKVRMMMETGEGGLRQQGSKRR